MSFASIVLACNAALLTLDTLPLVVAAAEGLPASALASTAVPAEALEVRAM
jgi:hypothetical protein